MPEPTIRSFLAACQALVARVGEQLERRERGLELAADAIVDRDGLVFLRRRLERLQRRRVLGDAVFQNDDLPGRGDGHVAVAQARAGSAARPGRPRASALRSPAPCRTPRRCRAAAPGRRPPPAPARSPGSQASTQPPAARAVPLSYGNATGTPLSQAQGSLGPSPGERQRSWADAVRTEIAAHPHLLASRLKREATLAWARAAPPVLRHAHAIRRAASAQPVVPAIT